MEEAADRTPKSCCPPRPNRPSLSVTRGLRGRAKAGEPRHRATAGGRGCGRGADLRAAEVPFSEHELRHLRLMADHARPAA